MSTCKLCKKSEATQRNSHIFTKFLTNSLKSTEKGNRVYVIDNNFNINRLRFTQDSPKEDFLFCPKCETKFNQFEYPIANTFYRSYKQNVDFAHVYIYKQLYYRLFLTTDYVSLKKFIYAQLYRAHVSNHPSCNHLVLREEIAEQLRGILNDELPFQDYKTLIFTSDLGSPSSNLITAINLLPDSAFVWINEFVFVVSFSGESIFSIQSKHAETNEPNNVRVCYMTWESWIGLRDVFFTILISANQESKS